MAKGLRELIEAGTAARDAKLAKPAEAKIVEKVVEPIVEEAKPAPAPKPVPQPKPTPAPSLKTEIEKSEIKRDLRPQLTEQVKQELFEELRGDVIRVLREELLEEVRGQLKEDLASKLFERIDQSNTILVEAIGKLYRKIDTLAENLNVEMPTPVLQVAVPARKVVRTIVRDKDGLIVNIVEDTDPDEGDSN